MRRRRWPLLVGLTVLGIAAIAAIGIIVIRARDSATPVGVDDVVGRYRASTTTSVSSSTTGPPTSTSLRPPAPGVYSYRTTGHDSIDILGGARHDYPDRTTITVSPIDCGVRLRWQPLEERWDEDDWCYGPTGISSPAQRLHHEFFGFSDDREWDCGAGQLVMPVDPRPGDEWSVTCRSGETVSPGTARVVGFEDIDVGGTPVRTVHIRVDTSREDVNAGTTVRDDWLVPDTGLLVRRRSSVESRSDSPVGTATYREELTLELESLEPRS